MIDLRPVGHVIGFLVAALGASMLVPMMIDLFAGNGHWKVFLNAAAVTGLTGGVLALATANLDSSRLTLQQTFLLTTMVWVMLPLFGAIPFLFSPLDATLTDEGVRPAHIKDRIRALGPTVRPDLNLKPNDADAGNWVI